MESGFGLGGGPMMGRPDVSLLQDLRTAFFERMIGLLFLAGWVYDLLLVLYPLTGPVYAWGLSLLALAGAGSAYILRHRSYRLATSLYLATLFTFITLLSFTHREYPLVFAYLVQGMVELSSNPYLLIESGLSLEEVYTAFMKIIMEGIVAQGFRGEEGEGARTRSRGEQSRAAT